MNYRLVCRMLGRIAILIGAAMVFSLPWAHPALGVRLHLNGADRLADGSATPAFETTGFLALIASIAICFATGGLMAWFGRGADGRLFRKEAMAVVGLSWLMATVLGALPYLFSGCEFAPGKPMTIADALFESQSGFSTTGATVITDLEQPGVPLCVLFWRSSTHLLGGLGIIVLFVAILGQGSAGKAMMRAEITGPTKEGSHSRTQHSAMFFAGIYLALNVVLAILLKLQGLSVFDALCHAFGTMATGGFSTYNASVGQFKSPAIDYLIVAFMVIAGTNFTLLSFVLLRQPGRLLGDSEWRAYLVVIAVSTALIVTIGLFEKDFDDFAGAVQYGLFQVVSIMTTTGYGTHDFDGWGPFNRSLLLLLMFIGGCAGSTGGGLKVIRFLLFFKILRLEIEQAYHPTVVRPLRLGGQPLEDQNLRKSILLYFALILTLFIGSWLFLVAFEYNSVWGDQIESKLVDSASAVAATLNNIGPGLGIVAPTENYASFSWYSKLLFIWLMMLGRLELYSVLVLTWPGFWKSR